MARTKSYMARHRPICAVLEEISNIATSAHGLSGEYPNAELKQIMTLTEEAITYAKRMDAKLVEIRNKENEDG